LFSEKLFDLAAYSSYIYFAEDTRATRVNLPIYVGSVPTDSLDTFNEKLTASLKRIIETGIDMQRMAMVINRDERQVSLYTQTGIERLTILGSCAAG
jgi:hypothetical protein